VPASIQTVCGQIAWVTRCIVVFSGALSTLACASPPPLSSPAGPLVLGAFIPDARGNAQAILTFATRVGTAPRAVMWYQDWAQPETRAFNTEQMDAVYIHGAVPVVTWEPWDAMAGPNQPTYALRQILAGSYDGYVHEWARAAATWNRPFYLRFAHEMNGTGYPWTPTINGNTPEEYVATWRHLHDIFQQEGATNTRWVWSPTVLPSDTLPLLATFYPGDAYVDWVGLDGYNWGTSQTWSHWSDLASVFAASYQTLAAMTTKPMMIAETASAESGGDKAQWITQGLLTDIPQRFPRIRAVIWFNEAKETDWRVDSSPATLAAYRAVARSPLYQGILP